MRLGAAHGCPRPGCRSEHSRCRQQVGPAAGARINSVISTTKGNKTPRPGYVLGKDNAKRGHELWETMRQSLNRSRTTINFTAFCSILFR